PCRSRPSVASRCTTPACRARSPSLHAHEPLALVIVDPEEHEDLATYLRDVLTPPMSFFGAVESQRVFAKLCLRTLRRDHCVHLHARFSPGRGSASVGGVSAARGRTSSTLVLRVQRR